MRELFPDDNEIAELDARVRLATAERTEALIEYEKLADSYLANGELEDAIRTFRKILDDIDEECLEARLQLAECLIQLERIDEAVNEYTRLAEILMRTGVFDGAVNLPFVLKVHRRVAELDPDNTSSRQWLAETFASRGNRDDALHEFDELLEIFEKNEDVDQLRTTLIRIAGLFPDELDYRERLAELYLSEEGGRDKAKAELQSLCRAAWQSADFETGLRVAETLLKIDPFYMEAHVLIGEALMGKGEKELAVEKMLSVALMYMGAGKLAEAEEVFKEVIGHFPGSVDAQRFLAAVIEERGESRGAAEHYCKAGLYSLENADYGMAGTYINYASELDPENPVIKNALRRLDIETPSRP
jgi:tetratricopeptide (TPR) repeat protein